MKHEGQNASSDTGTMVPLKSDEESSAIEIARTSRDSTVGVTASTNSTRDEETNPPPNPTGTGIIQAAAQTQIPATLGAPGEEEYDFSSAENKWSKNGFGQACPKAPLNGKFSAEESILVRNAIQNYCSAKSISTDRLCSECNHIPELKGAWMEIARALPHRTVQSVYRHGLRQLHPFKRGAWNGEECDLLYELVQRHGKKWSLIQGKLNRSADSCRDKYREMPREYVKGRWNLDETSKLVKLVREHLKLKPLKMPVDSGAENSELQSKGEDRTTSKDNDASDDSTNKAAKDELSSANRAQTKYLAAEFKRIHEHCDTNKITMPWSVISKRMGNRSRLSCFKKWQKMSGEGGENVSMLELEEESEHHSLAVAEASVKSVTAPATDAKSSTSKPRRGRKSAKTKSSSTKSSGRKRKGAGEQASSGQALTGVAEEKNATPALTKACSEESGAGTASSPSTKRSTRNSNKRAAVSDTTISESGAQKSKSAVCSDGGSKKESTGATVASTSHAQTIASDSETLKLLQELSQTDAHRHTDIDWAGLSHPRAFARWSEVLDMVEREDDSDEVLDLDVLSAQASMLLKRCATSSSAGDASPENSNSESKMWI